MNIKDFPQAKLSAVTNPEPSEPGDVWSKYKTVKTIEDMIKSGAESIEKAVKKIIK